MKYDAFFSVKASFDTDDTKKAVNAVKKQVMAALKAVSIEGVKLNVKN